LINKKGDYESSLFLFHELKYQSEVCHMKRKDFIKTSSLLLAGGALVPHMSCNTRNTAGTRTNWAANYT